MSVSGGMAFAFDVAPFSGTPRYWHGAVLRRNADELIFVGGSLQSTGSTLRTDEVWKYGLISKKWTQIQASGPTPRFGSALALDQTKDRLYLYGGNSGTGFDQCARDLWHLDLSKNEWISDPGFPNVILGRTFGTMTIDPHTGSLWIFNGYCGDMAFRSDLTFDPATSSWHGMQPPPEGPAERIGHVSVYDSHRNQVLVTGGVAPLVVLLPGQEREWRQVWQFDPNSERWTALTDGEAGPTSVLWSVGAYDELSDALVVFGGRKSGAGISNELWSFDVGSRTWTQLPQPDSSLRRLGAAGAYCPCQGGMAVMGGRETLSGAAGITGTFAFLPVESEKPFEWERQNLGAIRGNAPARGRIRFEEVSDGNLSAKRPIVSNVRLLNCATGERVGSVDCQWGRVGELKLRFDDLDNGHLALARSAHLLVTGRIEGQSTNFFARIGPWVSGSRSSATQNVELEQPKSNVRIVPTATGAEIRLSNSDETSGQLIVADVAGRIHYSCKLLIGNTVRWEGVDLNGRALRRGVYFIRVSAGGQIYKQTVILGQ